MSSSVVVIPRMQICPGDLLVYSRVLTHKASGYGQIKRFFNLVKKYTYVSDMDGSTQSLINSGIMIVIYILPGQWTS